MFDENDRSSHPDDTSRHIRRGARHEDDKTIEVGTSGAKNAELSTSMGAVSSEPSLRLMCRRER